MAFAGLKKQINKANQYVTEKMGGAEGTKLDMDFMDMERKTDVTVELVEELQTKTKEFLQPNPTARAKMIAPEGILADCMLLYGKKLGEDSVFATGLVEFGDALKQMADVKYSLDDNIKQNFLEPLHHLQTKDLKEVMHHRKKLQGRRLDFDCKRRRQAKDQYFNKSPARSPMGSPVRGARLNDDEIRGAEEKFAESLQLAQMGMYHLLENDIEQMSQLVTFAEALYDYHSQCADILKVLTETLAQKREEAEGRPKADFVPKTLADLNIESSMTGLEGGGANRNGGIIGSGNGYGGGGHSLQSNGRHYPPSRIKQNSMNSHHQLYSSQQNLSSSVFNNNNNNNTTSNNNVKNSNFTRSRIYGSYQSLSNTKVTTTTTNYNNNANQKNSQNNVDLDSSYDWLNAWNNPPPRIPSVSSYGTATSTSANITKNPTSTARPTSNSNKFYNFNSHSKTNIQLNDPWTASPLPSPMRSPAKTPAQNRAPCCTALYDFEPENPNELGFKENDTIQLLNKVDENWYEGSINGRTGYFPQSYVQIVVPLPEN
ncbi:endophilin-A isoform X4 [Hermetia illucens]|uniref:endophilin-A isoform X4 n=1 Tax=Hermetia illucens TaxID=343691 RepID=UPI0018CBF7E0|nr:endophilin-A isoform X4 [Hermetia illucens]